MHKDLIQSQSSPETTQHCDLAIIILNYNTASLLRDCLRTVTACKSNLQYRVCVVDNASNDGSAEMVREEFAQVHLITNSRNLGYTGGNNSGLRWLGYSDDAGTDGQDADVLPRYVLLLNPDTLVPADALEKMVRFMDNHPKAGVAGPRLRRPDGTLDKACRRSFPTPNVTLYRMVGLTRQVLVVHASMRIIWSTCRKTASTKWIQ